MHRNYTRRKFLQKPNFLKNYTCLGTNQGVFQRKKKTGRNEYELEKKLCYMFNIFNGPHSYIKIDTLGISQRKGTFVTSASKLTSKQKPFWFHKRAEKLELMI